MMLGDAISELYNKFRLHFFRQIFAKHAKGETKLTAAEAFSMEGIMALRRPTVSEFAGIMGISAPNAAYKINNLIQKGYVDKIQSESDRREYYLRPSHKYMEEYDLNYQYLEKMVMRIQERFSEEDCRKFEEMITVITDELMPELDRNRFAKRQKHVSHT